MKLILLFLVFTLSLSCSKDSQECKMCQVWGGNVNETRRICWDEGEPVPQQTDSQGNALNVFCPD